MANAVKNLFFYNNDRYTDIIKLRLKAFLIAATLAKLGSTDSKEKSGVYHFYCSEKESNRSSLTF